MLPDRPSEDQFYCRTCEDWVASPMHPARVQSTRVVMMCVTVAQPVHGCGIPKGGIPSNTPTAVRAKMIAMHSSEIQAADQRDLAATRMITGESYPKNWRNHTLYNFGDCTHTVQAILSVPYDDGSGDRRWDLVVCMRCGTQTDKHCPHARNTWTPDGRTLTCENCGVDGT